MEAPTCFPPTVETELKEVVTSRNRLLDDVCKKTRQHFQQLRSEPLPHATRDAVCTQMRAFQKQCVGKVDTIRQRGVASHSTVMSLTERSQTTQQRRDELMQMQIKMVKTIKEQVFDALEVAMNEVFKHLVTESVQRETLKQTNHWERIASRCENECLRVEVEYTDIVFKRTGLRLISSDVCKCESARNRSFSMFDNVSVSASQSQKLEEVDDICGTALKRHRPMQWDSALPLDMNQSPSTAVSPMSSPLNTSLASSEAVLAFGTVICKTHVTSTSQLTTASTVPSLVTASESTASSCFPFVSSVLHPTDIWQPTEFNARPLETSSGKRKQTYAKAQLAVRRRKKRKKPMADSRVSETCAGSKKKKRRKKRKWTATKSRVKAKETESDKETSVKCVVCKRFHPPMPEELENSDVRWISCDGKDCEKWTHVWCDGIGDVAFELVKRGEMEYHCDNCKSKAQQPIYHFLSDHSSDD